MIYTYNINGGKYHYMHIRYFETQDTLRFRVREGKETLEIKIPNFANLLERSINDRCGELGLTIADVVNYVEDVALDHHGAQDLLIIEKYVNGLSMFHALHTLICDILDIEN